VFVLSLIALGLGMCVALCCSLALISALLRRSPLWWLPGAAWQFAGVATIAGRPDGIDRAWILVAIGIFLFAMGTTSIVIVRRVRAWEPIPKAQVNE